MLDANARDDCSGTVLMARTEAAVSVACANCGKFQYDIAYSDSIIIRAFENVTDQISVFCIRASQKHAAYLARLYYTANFSINANMHKLSIHQCKF